MTTTARTPGPWSYQYRPYTSQDGYEIPAFEVHREEQVRDTNEGRPREEQDASARLVAATQEIYQALDRLFNIMHDYPSSFSAATGEGA
jgi:hypothetical protein